MMQNHSDYTLYCMENMGIKRLKVKSTDECYWCNYNKKYPNEKTKHSVKEYYWQPELEE